MHPEIRQKGPGACPICGMALEPVTVTLEEQPNEELDDMTRRFWWSLALTVPILVVHGFRVPPGPATRSARSRRGPELDRARARDAGRAVGRLAVLHARLGVGRHPPPEHVHAHRARCRGGVRLQRRRDVRPGVVSALRSAWTARSRCTSSRRPSSSCWSCSARCSNCGRAARRARRSGACSASRRRPRAGSRRRRRTGHPAGARAASAIACACGRASACLSTDA